MNRPQCLAMIAMLSLFGATPSRADFVFSGIGSNPETGNSDSASATFRITGDTLTLILTNTTAGGTLRRGDALTGVAFNIAGPNPTLTLTNIALTNPGPDPANNRIFTDKITSNTSDPLNGSFTNVLGDDPVAEFGVGASGFDGAFAAGSLGQGTGGVDFGIVAAGTFPNANASNSFNGSAFPLIQSSLTFTFTGINGLAESQIGGVRFLFGTSGEGVVNGDGNPVQAVPEPSSLALVGIAGVTGLVSWRKQRRVA